MNVAVSPVLTELAEYPFVRLEEAKRRAQADGIDLVDLGTGDPQEPTEAFIRRALADAVRERMGYPLAVGLPELRAAVAGWLARRFGVDVDPATEVIPTLGSKEAIFSFAHVVVSPERDLVAVTEPGYPVAERGARFAGAEVVRLPLEEEHGFLPDLDALDAEALARLAIVWVNYPNNPTGAVAPLAFYERLSALAREHGFLVCSDEAYSELWFDEPTASALQVGDRDNVVVFNTLSKRSSMTGYRSGFVAAAPEVISALRLYRPTVGTAPQEFVQRASIAAWSDEEHVERARERYRRKRAALLEGVRAAGLRVAGSSATFYLWVETPAGETSEEFAARLLRRGLVVAPGSFFGPSGEGYVRLAEVPPLAECERAARILAGLA